MNIENKGEKMKELKKAKMSLVGIDGNAFAIMGAVIRGLQRAGNSKAVIDEYKKKAMSGDYDNLICVSMDYIDDSEED